MADMADIQMPGAPSQLMQSLGWGNHHLEWHLTRIWDIVSQATRDWAESQGWQRAAIQEGEPGNGLEFLAMHRVMVQGLVERFPEHSRVFDGWASPPQNPSDPDHPLPGGETTAFNRDMSSAVSHLSETFDGLGTDDELGLFVETSLRPTQANPRARSDNPASGIHNYLHNRWSDDDSSINLGDSTVNIFNQRFWDLHGWIESVWTEFRKIRGFSDTEPTYLAALEEGRRHMGLREEHLTPLDSPEALGASSHDKGDHHHHHPSPEPIEIPDHVKQDIADFFYFCEIK